MADEMITGRCLCGGVTFEAGPKPLWTALCHCDSCRRAASAPLVAWMGFPVETVRWIGKRSHYTSSKGVERSFCPTCGSPMSFESARWPGEIHLYAASRDDPAAYVPQLHCYYAERLAWLDIGDDLPKHAASADGE